MKFRNPGHSGEVLPLPARTQAIRPDLFPRKLRGESGRGTRDEQAWRQALEQIHPWEIAFGNPHGILISPRYHLDGNRWSYSLPVHAEGWYPTAARMALALAAAQVRLELHEWERVVKALSGVDDVEVGRGFRQISYEELRQVRPDALSAIRWDAVPAVEIIAPDQLERVQVQLEGEEPLASGAAVLGGARFRKRGGRLPRL